MAKKGKLRKRKRAERGEIKRPVNLRRYDQHCLVVCEDQKTEPVYFETFKDQFPKKTFYLRCIGTGRDPLGVVEQTVLQKQKMEKELGREIDFVWAVFDKDDADENQTKIDKFNAALKLASENKIEIAFSNEVFEVWLLLHFQKLNLATPIPRAKVYELLENKIQKADSKSSFKYKHGDSEVIQQVVRLGDEKLAIERAKVLKSHFAKTEDLLKRNPFTSVFELIELLRGLADFYYFKS
ncbi:MAG: RloB family protein [Bacteroidia bacterium]